MVFENLPLKEDMEEHKTIYNCIIYLFNNYPNLVSGFIGCFKECPMAN